MIVILKRDVGQIFSAIKFVSIQKFINFAT